MTQIPSRLRVAWAKFAARFERMVLKMAFEALTAAVAAGSAAADRLIAKSQGDASALADAQSTIANFETDAAAVVQPLVDKLTSAAPEAPASDEQPAE